MRLLTEQRAKAQALERALEVDTKWIADHSDALRVISTDYLELENKRVFYAISRVQGVIRGFLARVLAKDLRQRRKCVVNIQKVARGFIGRRRVKELRWLRICVVPTQYSLKLLLDRSKVVREEAPWREMYDTTTKSFWYYNPSNKYNTWDPPPVFFKHLVCSWEPPTYPEREPFAQPCRRTFDNIREFHAHLLSAHSWYCQACDSKNTSMTYPKCDMCGNTLTKDGEHLEKALRARIGKVQKHLFTVLKDAPKDQHDLPIQFQRALKMIYVKRRKNAEPLIRTMNDLPEFTQRRRFEESVEAASRPETPFTRAMPSQGTLPPVRDVKEIFERRMQVRRNLEIEKENEKKAAEQTEMMGMDGADGMPPAYLFGGGGGGGGTESLVDSTTTTTGGPTDPQSSTLPSLSRSGPVHGLAGGDEDDDQSAASGSTLPRLDGKDGSVGDRGGVSAKAEAMMSAEELLQEALRKEEEMKASVKDQMREYFAVQTTVYTGKPGEDGFMHHGGDGQMRTFGLGEQDLQRRIVQTDENGVLCKSYREILLPAELLMSETLAQEASAASNANDGNAGVSGGLGAAHLEYKLAPLPDTLIVDDLNDGEDDTGYLGDASGGIGGEDSAMWRQFRRGSSNMSLNSGSWMYSEDAQSEDMASVASDEELDSDGERQIKTDAPDWMEEWYLFSQDRNRQQGEIGAGTWADEYAFGEDEEEERKKTMTQVALSSMIAEEEIKAEEEYQFEEREHAKAQRRLEGSPDKLRRLNTMREKELKKKEAGDDDEEDVEAKAKKAQKESNAAVMRALLEKVDKELAARNRIRVCTRYLSGRCRKSNCKYAHPGLRDRARVVYERVYGREKKPVVQICSKYKKGKCRKGIRCSKYHIYIRPSTQDIIRRVYPVENGIKSVELPSGVEISGNVRGGIFHGYAVMTWPNGDKYIGDFNRGERSGFGIFRGADGREYVGQWLAGRKHGWGVLSHPNGEVYLGEWVNGDIEGVGRLESRNGDVYEGEFHRNKYHGVGWFKKANGDQFLGHCDNGMASGVGILALANGVKYKGEFLDNARHGKGFCSYPHPRDRKMQGARYAGFWVRNRHDGFGIFVSPDGERYVGEWRNDRKHGWGRYFFANGDVYDGQFLRNMANGKGFYHHVRDGNMYSGEWQDDRRNGKGTYVFKNRSRYDGYFENNQIHGRGVFKFATGAQYSGEFSHSVKHGRGVYIWATGNKYRGQFRDERMCGFGEMEYNTSGHRYVGQWRDNKKNGKGVFTFADGNIYEGDFVDDEMHGKGKLTYHPNSALQEVYEGDIRHNKRHGYGVYRYRLTDGTVYEGDWVNGVRHGKGTMRFKDGSFYRGDIMEEKMAGFGIFVWPDGTQYEGDWRDNMRHGVGTLLSSDGSIFKGEFFKNQKHGKGRIVYANGNCHVGSWHLDGLDGPGTFQLTASVVEAPKDEDGLPRSTRGGSRGGSRAGSRPGSKRGTPAPAASPLPDWLDEPEDESSSDEEDDESMSKGAGGPGLRRGPDAYQQAMEEQDGTVRRVVRLKVLGF